MHAFVKPDCSVQGMHMDDKPISGGASDVAKMPWEAQADGKGQGGCSELCAHEHAADAERKIL